MYCYMNQTCHQTNLFTCFAFVGMLKSNFLEDTLSTSLAVDLEQVPAVQTYRRKMWMRHSKSFVVGRLYLTDPLLDSKFFALCALMVLSSGLLLMVVAQCLRQGCCKAAVSGTFFPGNSTHSTNYSASFVASSFL